ncbi:ribonuclease H2 subunit A-like [Sitophilus oryzae]|uniref:Ribonuclease n=1 Tax=Sitophilus oryzae TaxID=7048 RepID=A0A6J2Y549_SITOR|nr:ribonuclease H2 subunit A-like [Sitophilus oryzae]
MKSEKNEEPTVTITNLSQLQTFIKERNNWQNVCYMSQIPEVCREYPCILGIDEAGRGPVLGPMVYGTAFIPINEQTLLETLECADSKVLTEEKRDNIFEKICDQSGKIGWGVEIIAPTSICNSMLSRSRYSLNQVSMDAAIGLIRAALNLNVKIEHVYVDTVGKPEKYQEYLKSIFPKLKITVAKKADSTYPIVSAASICAKVTRDHSLKVWNFIEDLEVTEFGSGYPADPDTRQFLTDQCEPVFGYPQLVRFSWSTAENMLENLAYHIECEEEMEQKTPPPNTMAITSFFKMTRKNVNNVKTMHEFFTKRNLSREVDF